MFRLMLYFVLFLVPVEQTVAETCQQEAQKGCKVADGHAQCESWNLAASIHDLPPCTTRITFSFVANPTFYGQHLLVHLSEVDFSPFTNLQELELRANYSDLFHVKLVIESQALIHLKNVTILRFRIPQDRFDELNDANLDMYGKLKSLKVLDLTRAKHIGLAVAKHIIGAKSSAQTLILKNIQEIARENIYTPSADLAHFVCQSNVEYLDLSYNDISYIDFFDGRSCSSKLKYLNLDHNIIASFTSEGGSVLLSLSLISSLETLSVMTSNSPKYHDDLWNDDDNRESKRMPELETDDIELSPLTTLLQNTPLAFLAGYDFWLENVLRNCGNFSYLDLAKCFVQGHEDLCEVFHCLSPTLHTESCPRDLSGQMKYFAQRMCNYRSCLHNVLFPMPPKLNSMLLQNAGKYLILDEYPDDNLTTVCIHPHNNLEYIDASNMNFEGFQALSLAFRYSVTGLTRLKYLNVQGCQLSLVHIHIPSPDMQSLRELHIGGNILTTDGILPVEMLQKQSQLSVLNLSHANLQGIEANAFENHHHLSVLDLSHNQLTISSLVNLDLSKTMIKSLNLSHNGLTTMPRSFRDQLDNMGALELYVSGNTFLCNCDNLEFLHWVQRKTQITFHYGGDHVCTEAPGNTIHNIDVDSLNCDWYWRQPVIIVCSSLALLLVVLAIVSLYRKRFFILNVIFHLRERCCVPSDEDSNVSYKYDAFVVYSSVDDDRLWVHYKLVSELENVYGFRLCIHHRDFLAGCDVSANIDQAIACSRKVIVIISENFLRSDWCIEEVHRVRSVDHNKFVVVMYKDVLLSGVPVPTVIQHLLQSRTYIDWNEAPEAQKLFWKRLRRALYSKQQASNINTSDQSLSLLMPSQL